MLWGLTNGITGVNIFLYIEIWERLPVLALPFAFRYYSYTAHGAASEGLFKSFEGKL